MFNLSEKDIHLNSQADNKQQAIEKVAAALISESYVEEGYLQGMLNRELQTSTFLGNGIAIPHGTTDTRDQVKKTGVQVFQFPQGIEWGDENIAYVVIGIAASSDEHLTLLRQLTHVLGDEETALKLKDLQDKEAFRKILLGEVENFKLKGENVNINLETNSLLAMVAVNAENLQKQASINQQFINEIIGSAALPLGKGLWITDSLVGNLKNDMAFSRVKTAFSHNGKAVRGVVSVSVVNNDINDTLVKLLDSEVQTTLLSGTKEQILAVFNGHPENAQNTPLNSNISQGTENTVIGTFTVRNEHGLHARPCTVLVNIIKQFSSTITVENLNRTSKPVSAKSMMKIVALGAVAGHRLRFVATGNDAKAAIEAIAKGFVEGLGETVSQNALEIEDTIEEAQASVTVTTTNNDNVPDNSVEAVFVINNEHGLHARPATVLVSEVKKYRASIAVQNLDRETQLVSAKSMMKVVALGATKGHRLRFVATGEDAQNAIEAIGSAIASGLGE